MGFFNFIALRLHLLVHIIFPSILLVHEVIKQNFMNCEYALYNVYYRDFWPI